MPTIHIIQCVALSEVLSATTPGEAEAALDAISESSAVTFGGDNMIHTCVRKWIVARILFDADLRDAAKAVEAVPQDILIDLEN